MKINIFLYLDTSAFLDLFYPKREYHRDVEKIIFFLNKNFSRKTKLITSYYTLIEAYHSMIELKIINDLLQKGYTGREILSRIKKIQAPLIMKKQEFETLKDFTMKKKINLINIEKEDFENALFLSLWLPLDTYDSIHLSIVLKEQYVKQQPVIFITSDDHFYNTLKDDDIDLLNMAAIFPINPKQSDKYLTAETVETISNLSNYSPPEEIIRKIGDRIEEREKEKYFPHPPTPKTIGKEIFINIDEFKKLLNLFITSNINISEGDEEYEK